MSCNKFYMMAGAAVGKSTFAGQRDHFLGYRVVDFDDELPPRSFITWILMYLSRVMPRLRRVAKMRSDMVLRRREPYFEHAINFLLKQDEPVVVMGRKTPDDFDHQKYAGQIEFSIVLLSEEEHKRNCAARKKRMRNPLPFFNHWSTDFERIRRIREQFRTHAARHNIPVYDSIPAAIEGMHQKNSSAQSVG